MVKQKLTNLKPLNYPKSNLLAWDILLSCTRTYRDFAFRHSLNRQKLQLEILRLVDPFNDELDAVRKQ